MVNCGIPFCWIWQNPERSYILLHYNNRIHAAGLLFLLEVLVGPLWKYLWGHFSHWWSWNCSAPTILLPCPRRCPDSSDFRGEVKKNIHWEPGANWRRPRVITWGGTAVPACWGWAVRAAAGTVALSTNCQLSPCYLCCWEVSRPFLIPALKFLLWRVCSHESPIVCQPRQLLRIETDVTYLGNILAALQGHSVLDLSGFQLWSCFLY